MHENTRRALVQYATRHGLVGGVPVLAVALALVTRFGELTPRSYSSVCNSFRPASQSKA